jgi:ligand-binding SRPBCC domain-containing protein
MPHFQTMLTIPRLIEEVFDFFRRPANLLRVTPPDMNLRLVEAPEVIQLGSRISLEARRYGVAQKLVSEVTSLEPPLRLVDVQRQGPFRKWVQTQRFETVAGGTQVTFHIEYEPPGGMLGFVMTAASIEKELRALFDYRARKLLELLGGTQGLPPLGFAES